MFLCHVKKLNRDSRTSSLIKEFILITLNKKKLRISQKIGFHIIIHLSVYECHLTLIGPVASMSEIANVTVACQWTKRSYILITSLTETPYSLWPQKRSYAYKKIETLTWVQIPFRYWNSMINDKHLAYWSVCFLGCASAVCCGDFRLWAWPPNSLSLPFTRQHRGQTNQKCMISKQTHPLPQSRVPFEDLILWSSEWPLHMNFHFHVRCGLDHLLECF